MFERKHDGKWLFQLSSTIVTVWTGLKNSELFLRISIKRLYLLFWIYTRWKRFTHLLNYSIISFAKNTNVTMVCSAPKFKLTKQPIVLRVTWFESHSWITSIGVNYGALWSQILVTNFWSKLRNCTRMRNRLLEVNDYAFQNYMFDGSRFLDLNF